MMLRSACLVSLPSFLACAALGPARAQYFTNHDGYAASGAYRVQVELAPSLWLPAASGTLAFARPSTEGHVSNAALPSLSLDATPHAAFTGDGLVRYGPYSAELDVQYLSATDDQMRPAELAASYVRIAPGLGYQLYRGKLFSIPSSLDARAGLSYVESWQELQNTENPASHSLDVVQPWIGTRIDFVPANNWRIELAGLVQGLGAGNASWGWGASGLISYAVNDWCAVGLGYKTLNTEHNAGNRGIGGAPKPGLNLTGYGPMLGVTFRFGESPPPPPAPDP
jgi:hypothetical protein